MLNFKFIKSQLKSVWINILVFTVVMSVLVLFANIFSSMGGKWVVHNINNGIDNGIISNGLTLYSEGAYFYLNQTIFSFDALIIFLGFGISLSTVLISRDINRGYIASWLSTSMSRSTIFNSKLFITIMSTVFINFWMVVLEMISYSIRMPDFSSVVGPLLLANLTLLLMSLMVVSMTWIIFAIFRKTGISLGILFGIFAWFVLCLILYTLRDLPSLSGLKYFRYFNINSLMNSPLHFIENEPTGEGTFYNELLPIKTANFAWQLPVMFIVATGFFTGAQFIVKDKDFSF